MTWPSRAQLDDLVARFRARTLPKPEWTHQAHLAVGTWHVFRFGPIEAMERLRSGITRLNESHGTANTDTAGYHESITRAYVTLIAAFLSSHPATGTAAGHAAPRVQQLLASPLAAKDALLVFYSQDVLMSVAARRGWVEPDRAALRWPPTGTTGG